MTHPQLIAEMSEPAFYPERPERVDVLQTHISLVFIAGDLVYKVKKAVDFGFLDFTTLEKRRFFCEEELRLNRRLAPEIYLEVSEIVETPGGRLALGAPGRVVDYAVVMRRIPEDRMLKNLLARRVVSPSDMARIAEKVVDFHAKAETGGTIDEVGGLETVRRNHEENFEQTHAFVGVTIPEYQYGFIRSSTVRFLGEHEELFRSRVANHHIRDCHGDLHIEHICPLDPDIVIFDCIEFNERFRYEDVAAEVAFLAMDLDFNGYSDLAQAFVDAYVAYSGDTEIHQLLNFYKAYYAYVRGKVIGFRINDPAISERQRSDAHETAARYFDLAYSYVSRPERPTLVLMAGLMGTGKSVLAEGLAARLGAQRLQMDMLRKELLGISATEHRFEAFGQGIYSEEVTRRTYSEALRQAEDFLQAGQSVVIDASYKRREERLRAKALAERIGADFRVVECRCAEDVLRRRLRGRLHEAGAVSDGRWELYKAQRSDFDAVEELSATEHIVIETDASTEACMDTVLRSTHAATA